jgi:hypothetical protein
MRSNRSYIAAMLLVVLLIGCDLAKYPIDDPAVVKIDARLLGQWKTTNKDDKNDRYTLVKKDDFHYLVTARYGKEKKNHKFNAYLSEVEHVSFLNIHCKEDTVDGYFFLKIMNVNASGNKVITVTVSDSTMKYLKNPAQVKERIRKNLNNPVFYSDTTHMYKIK